MQPVSHLELAVIPACQQSTSELGCTSQASPVPHRSPARPGLPPSPCCLERVGALEPGGLPRTQARWCPAPLCLLGFLGDQGLPGSQPACEPKGFQGSAGSVSFRRLWGAWSPPQSLSRSQPCGDGSLAGTAVPSEQRPPLWAGPAGEAHPRWCSPAPLRTRVTLSHLSSHRLCQLTIWNAIPPMCRCCIVPSKPEPLPRWVLGSRGWPGTAASRSAERPGSWAERAGVRNGWLPLDGTRLRFCRVRG